MAPPYLTAVILSVVCISESRCVVCAFHAKWTADTARKRFKKHTEIAIAHAQRMNGDEPTGTLMGLSGQVHGGESDSDDGEGPGSPKRSTLRGLFGLRKKAENNKKQRLMASKPGRGPEDFGGAATGRTHNVEWDQAPDGDISKLNGDFVTAAMCLPYPVPVADPNPADPGKPDFIEYRKMQMSVLLELILEADPPPMKSEQRVDVTPQKAARKQGRFKRAVQKLNPFKKG